MAKSRKKLLQETTTGKPLLGKIALVAGLRAGLRRRDGKIGLWLLKKGHHS